MHVAIPSKKTRVACGIISIIAVIIFALILSKPEAKKRKPPSGPNIAVETVTIAQRTLTPDILSYGLVEPRTKSNLVAQVSGQIILLSESFRDGGFFSKGDLLLKIDPTDYEIDIDIAHANVAEAERALEEEKALAQQAKADWFRLGNQEEPSPLVLREPQLKAAKANVTSVRALLKKAKINLARTEIRAPFDGRVLSTNIDLGQVSQLNGVLGTIYATDAVEIRLPIKNHEIPLINLPEVYRNHSLNSSPPASVHIISNLAQEEVWQGTLVRTASSIDDSSRQLYVVARIDDPFGEKAKGRFPLKIGQYVTAIIEGTRLHNVISLPNNAIYQGNYVYTYKDGAVFRKAIHISWQNDSIAIAESGLIAGDELVISPLGQVASGTAVRKSNPATALKEATPRKNVAKSNRRQDDRQPPANKGNTMENTQ